MSNIDSIERGVSTAHMNYSASISRVLDSARCLHSSTLAQAHHQAVTEVLRDFDAIYHQHGKFHEHRNSLLEDIEKSYEEFESINERKNKQAVDEALQRYDSRMNDVCGSGEDCVHPFNLEASNTRARTDAIQYFVEQRSAACRDQPEDSYGRRLNYGITRRYSKLKERNEERNMNAVCKAHSCYTKKAAREPPSGFMGTLFRVRDFNVSKRHGPAEAEALRLFNSLRRGGPQHSSDKYLEMLHQRIHETHRFNILMAARTAYT